MPIHVLDPETIDKIAAGEVVERPSSVVKELVENSIDAGATAITVDIKDGGIEYIRITDNGCGIPKDQIRVAFLRHATSKIASAADLQFIGTLGFRGEALSSIAAVSRLEIITKTADQITGTKVSMDGASERSFEEVGAPDGTTMVVRNLFFNTPARRQFLKTPSTEGSYCADLMERIALSHPEIAFQFTLNGQTRFHTSGKGDLLEVIYRVYGREIASKLIPIDVTDHGIRIFGYLGMPELVRSNRNFEIYYMNNRMLKSDFIAKSIEEGYREYLMLHKFPLCMLYFEVDPQKIDVNVHPTKMDVRISDPNLFFASVSGSIHDTLKNREMIPQNFLVGDRERKALQKKAEKEIRSGKNPEPFEQARQQTARRESAEVRNSIEPVRIAEETRYGRVAQPPKPEVFHPGSQEKVPTPPKEEKPYVVSQVMDRRTDVKPAPETASEVWFDEDSMETAPGEKPAIAKGTSDPVDKTDLHTAKMSATGTVTESLPDPVIPAEFQGKATQQNLFEEKIIQRSNRDRFRFVGQVFDTYWIIQYANKMIMIDQHAAHEKVNYERMMRRFREKQVVSQRLLPPVVVTLSGKEESVLQEHLEAFRNLGYEVEEFGGNEYALRAVPTDLYGHSERELFLAVLDELSDGNSRGSYKIIEEKIASMSCKASVKGGDRLSQAEAEALIDELLSCENPYNCPHGRPTIIELSRSDLEKRFKRIVD